jgi:hypothetical protein
VENLMTYEEKQQILKEQSLENRIQQEYKQKKIKNNNFKTFLFKKYGSEYFITNDIKGN